MLIFWEQSEPLLQEFDEIVGHLWHLMQITIPVHVAVTRSNRVIHKHDIRKLAPRALIVFQRGFRRVFDPERPYFHQSTIFRTASWSPVEPDHGTLPVRDMLILKVPKEQIAVVLWCDFDMPVALN